MNNPPSKKELLETIQQHWNELNELLAELSEEQMLDPTVQDNWSIKDILAHIATWEELATDRLTAGLSGTPANYPIMKSWDDINAYNTERYIVNQNRPLEKVLEEIHRIHEEYIAQIEKLDDDFIAGPMPFEWAKDTSVHTLISANAHWHYTEHIEAIEKWMK
ncbi:MAG: ClbS/DfsB family four-helix bundle protein [Chloroflexi bacterium]|jgi:hypothetical protein|nr:ClbS/DfsB family four-helix bundle protein [Chloroflexota bacterium]